MGFADGFAKLAVNAVEEQVSGSSESSESTKQNREERPIHGDSDAPQNRINEPEDRDDESGSRPEVINEGGVNENQEEVGGSSNAHKEGNHESKPSDPKYETVDKVVDSVAEQVATKAGFQGALDPEAKTVINSVAHSLFDKYAK